MSALPFARLCERTRRRRPEEYQRSSEGREGGCSRKDAESEGCNDFMVIFLQSHVTYMKLRFLFGAFAALVLLGAGCTRTTAPEPTAPTAAVQPTGETPTSAIPTAVAPEVPASAVIPELIVPTTAQEVKGGKVTVLSVTLDKPGYVAIHADAAGKPGPVLGHSELLPQGKKADVNVSVDSAKAGSMVWPMLHYDDGDGAYAFPGPDVPVQVGGNVVVKLLPLVAPTPVCAPAVEAPPSKAVAPDPKVEEPAMPKPTTHAIDIKAFTFSVKELKVKRGDTVIWTQQDSVGHTVTSDTGSELGSPVLSVGQTYSHTFTTKGTFAYHCTPHPGMTAKVVVE